MAQEAEAERGGSSIARASNRKLGYDTGQVDAFLNRAHALYDSDEQTLTQKDIQDVSFDLAKGGYDIAQVDAALSRLERAVVDKQTAAQISDQGRVAWRAQTEQLYHQIAQHADRAERTRFQDGKKKQPSYDRKQVDKLIDDIIDKAAAELGVDGVDKNTAADLANVTAASVSNAIFTQRKGPRGYDERQVDYYLNACVQLLSRLESFDRVSDLVNGGSDTSSEPAAVAAAQPVAAVAPLFPTSNTPAPASSSTPAVSDGQSAETAAGESFDALHKAEQAIFTAPATASQAAPVPAPAVIPAAPAVPAEPSATHEASPVPAPASQQQADAPSVSADFLRKADPSLAELAHLAEATQEKADAPSVFQPHMPSLTTPSVPAVSVSTSRTEPAAYEPATPVPAATEQPAAPQPKESAAEQSAADMPVSFAPASKPAHTVPRGRVSQSAPQAVELAEPAPAATASVVSAAPAPSAAAPSDHAAADAVADVPPSFAPEQPVERHHAHAAAQPVAAESAPVEPQTSAAPVKPAQPPVVQPVQPKDTSTTVFPSIFPQTDTDIPDLSFPSLYGDDDDKR